MQTRYEQIFDTTTQDDAKILWNCLISFKNEIIEKYKLGGVTDWRWFQRNTTTLDLKEDCITDKGTYRDKSIRMGEFVSSVTNPDFLIEKLRRTIWEHLCN
jgi:hypothetical protein